MLPGQFGQNHDRDSAALIRPDGDRSAVRRITGSEPPCPCDRRDAARLRRRLRPKRCSFAALRPDGSSCPDGIIFGQTTLHEMHKKTYLPCAMRASRTPSVSCSERKFQSFDHFRAEYQVLFSRRNESTPVSETFVVFSLPLKPSTTGRQYNF